MTLDFLLTLQKVLILFLLIVIGFVAGKTHLISEEGQKDITALTLKITMPATIFNSMQLPFNTQRLLQAGIMIGIFLVCYLLMFTIGKLVSNRLNLSPGQKDIFRAATLMSNTSFMGYPIILSLLGNEALFFAVICGGLIFEIVSWTLGIYLTSRNGGTKAHFNWRNIVFSPGILSIIVGLIFFFFQLPVIEPFKGVLNILAPATSPLAMIVVGLMLSRSDVIATFRNKYIFIAACLKLVIVPLIILFTLKAIGFTGLTLVIPVILLAMPTASYVAMFSNNYNNDANFASQIVFMTSLLSVISIPFVTLFF